MKQRLAIFILFLAQFTFFAASCERDPDPTKEAKDVDPRLGGIWKVESFRMAGANLSQYNPLSYVIIEPSRSYLAIITGQSGMEASLLCEDFMVKDTGSELLLFSMRDLEGDGSGMTAGASYVFPYKLLKDNTLMLYPKPSAFLPESIAEREEDAVSINIGLRHDTALEDEAGGLVITDTATRGLWDSITGWFKDQAVKVAENIIVTIAKFHSNVVAPLEPVVKYESWKNTGGWQRINWMSMIPDDILVCNINIPGTHDSGTDASTMSFLAKEAGAAVQKYSIGRQFDMGARFFDLRIGTGFEKIGVEIGRDDLNVKLVRNEDEIGRTADLELFHGPMSTGVWYRKTLEELAEKVHNSDEFIFVKTQWEDHSYGILGFEGVMICSQVNILNHDPVTRQIAAETTQNLAKRMIDTVSMDIAHRIQKEINVKYGNDLFINYSSDLTVGRARGHIILVESKYGVTRALDNPQVTYVFAWPDNACRHGHMCAYDQGTPDIRSRDPHNIDVGDGYGYNMYLQNYYEMRLWEGNKTQRKKDAFHELACKVTDLNRNQGKRILGFNAMNANAGAECFYDLDTYEFAHMFNGYAFNEYVENMTGKDDAWCSGIVTMDYFGADSFTTYERGLPVAVYGDLLSWAVIESNFYSK